MSEIEEAERRKQAELLKRATKEAIREFLEEKWRRYTSRVGEWVISVIAAAVVGALVWLILRANGWTPPQ